MRRLFHHRTNNLISVSVRPSSSSSFKHSQKRKGHSLMRRTELSWEKLEKYNNNRLNNNKPAEQRPRINDYYAKQQKEHKPSEEAARKNNKSTRNLISVKLRTMTVRNQFRHNKELPQNISKTQQCIMAASPRKIESRKLYSMKSLNTTDTKNSDSVYASNYHMENILGNAIKMNCTPIEQQYCIYQISSQKMLNEVKEISKLGNQSNIAKSGLTSNASVARLFENIKHSQISLNSRKRSLMQSQSQTVNCRISLHLEIIGELAQYSKSIIEMYQQIQEWEQLIFLVYKKYYVERVKVLNFLKGNDENPFLISACQITKSEMEKFRRKLQASKLIKEIEAQNRKVRESLRNFYNLIIEKSGDFINMDKFDDFSAEIYADMNTEIQLLQEMLHDDRATVEKRLMQIFRTAFLISELDGRFVMSYEQSLDDDDFGSYFTKASYLFQKLLKSS